MKRFTVYATCLLFLLSFTLSAQVSNARKTMSAGVYEALVIQIPDLDDKIVSNL